MREPLEHIEAREERGRVERRSHLAGSPPYPFDHLPFVDLPASLKSVLGASIADGVVEREELAGHQDQTVELGRSDVDVLPALGLILHAREVRIVRRENSTDVEPLDHRASEAWGDVRHRDDRASLGHVGVCGSLDRRHCPLRIEVSPGNLGEDVVVLEVEPRVRGGSIERHFQPGDPRLHGICVDRDDEREIDLAPLRASATIDTLEEIARAPDVEDAGHGRFLVDPHAKVRERSFVDRALRVVGRDER